MSTEQWVTHERPANRADFDFVIGAVLDSPGELLQFEQIPSRRVSERSFQICALPFLAYGLALGDVVSTEPRGVLEPGRDEYLITAVTERSGNGLLRVWIRTKDSKPHESGSVFRKLSDAFNSASALFETYDHRLFSINVETPEKMSVYHSLIVGITVPGEVETEVSVQPI